MLALLSSVAAEAAEEATTVNPVVPDEEDGFVRVEVSDSGVGLPPGEEDLVFEEFHRAEAHAASFAGTGLGLSLCRRIVNRHGGSIWARNNPDRGATFTFTLPAA